MRHVGRYYVTLLLNRELESRAKLCLFSVYPNVIKDFSKIINLPKTFLRRFENVAPGLEAFHAIRPENGSCILHHSRGSHE